MKKEFDWSIIWVVLCLLWLILSLGYSIKGFPEHSNRCLIQAVLFYLFYMTDAIRGRLDDIDRRINKKMDKEE